MRNVDLRIDPKWIVPIEPAGFLSGHALIVDAGCIVALVPSAVADSAYAARSRLDLPGHVLLPGLVNAHTHAAMTLFRGVADDLPLRTWLEREIWPREARFVSPEFVYDGVRLAAAEMLRGGTTCFNDMYFFPEVTARAATEVGMRACIGLIVIDFPSAWAGSADEYLDKGLALHDELRNHPLLIAVRHLI